MAEEIHDLNTELNNLRVQVETVMSENRKTAEFHRSTGDNNAEYFKELAEKEETIEKYDQQIKELMKNLEEIKVNGEVARHKEVESLKIQNEELTKSI